MKFKKQTNDEKINYIINNPHLPFYDKTIFDKFEKVTNHKNEYQYMLNNTFNIIKIFNQYPETIKNINSIDYINNYHGEHICISVSIYIDENDIDFTGFNTGIYNYMIFKDKKTVFFCNNGFTIYDSIKKYYNKQFINLIIQRNYKETIKLRSQQ